MRAFTNAKRKVTDFLRGIQRQLNPDVVTPSGPPRSFRATASGNLTVGKLTVDNAVWTFSVFVSRIPG